MAGHGKSNQGASRNFAQVATASIPRSSFNRSSGLKTTFDASLLIPIWHDEALPGDTFNMKMTTFCRLSTPLHPVMDNMKITSWFFSVPIRLVWENWEKLNGAQDNPGDSTAFLVPQMESTAGTGHQIHSLSDYLGIPTDVTGIMHSCLWHRAYTLIYDEWFRSQDLENKVTIDKSDTIDLDTDHPIQTRNKAHDYFTSLLPWPQKGPSVQLPLGSSADIYTDATGFENVSVYSTVASAHKDLVVSGADLQVGASLEDADFKLYADLSSATAATINELREAFRIQEIYEKDARGGTRYTEILKSHFGVTSDDARLQRPEYLGGGQQAVQITPVPQTSKDNNNPFPGQLGAFGISTSSNHGFQKSFTEHCLLLGIICCTADLTYQSGLERMMSRRTRWDYYWPSFAHLGEQFVPTKELFCVGDLSTTDEDVLGYAERYSEYKYAPSRITGQFRSSAPTSLDTWHLAEDFGDPELDPAPILNKAFIQNDVPIFRVVAVPSEPDFLGDFWFDLTCARPMPTFAIPGMTGHF